MARSRTAIALAVVAVALTAGCMGFLGGGGSGSTPTVTPEPVNDSTTAEDVRSAAVAATADVDTYVVEGRAVSEYTGDVSQSATTNTTARVNRSARRLNLTEVQSTDDRTYTVDTYLVNETVYGFSDFYGTRFGSDWIRATPPDFGRAWDRRDTLARQRAVLEAANVTLAGTQTLAGTETYVLDATLPGEAYDALVGSAVGNLTGNVTVRSASFRFWIATDADRPVQSTATLDLLLTDPTPNATVETTVTFRYEYGGEVTVALPKGASNARNVTDELYGQARLVPGGGPAPAPRVASTPGTSAVTTVGAPAVRVGGR
jgi:hypothetical protein